MSAAELIARLRPAAAPGRAAPRRRGRGRTARSGRSATLGRRRRGPVRVLGVALVLALLLGGWLWLRGSSLVAVEQVTVIGAEGTDSAQIHSALASAARGMTTLEVRMGTLRAAVAPYPIVRRLDVTTHFPHRLTIRVIERVPVATLAAGPSRIAVAGDGTVLRDVPATGLPEIALAAPPGGERVSDGSARAALALLADAPAALLPRLASVTLTGSYGLVAQVVHGPSLRFGDAGQALDKWRAVATLLAAPANAGAVYLDVTDPHRPAAGVGAAAAAALAQGDSAANVNAAAGASTPLTGTGAGAVTTPTTATPAASTSTPAPAAAPAPAGAPAPAPAPGG